MHMVILLRITSLLILTKVAHQSILRLPCSHIFADFNQFEFNKALINSVLRSITDVEDVQCMIECIRDPRCATYNFNFVEKICELNSKTKYHKDAVLVTKENWMFKSTNYNETMIGPTCQELKPCAPGHLCKDTCDSPFFECIYCNETQDGLPCSLQTKDHCINNPCKNNGNCSNEDDTYSCACANGFTGKSCETEIDDCNSLPCLNGGICEDKFKNFTCQCDNGYEGRICEIEIDECSSNPCQNDGTCQDKIGHYTCQCPPGFNGSNCEKDIDECKINPCKYGGTCLNNPGSYSCQCVLGYTGTHCETDLGGCSSNPCKNGAVCINGINQFSCNCSSGYLGKLCYPDCGSTLYRSYGAIASPMFPNNYPHDLLCSWTISVAAGFNISIEFQSFDIEFSSSCSYDHVRINDGAANTGSWLTENLCGNALAVKKFTSTQSKVYIEFKTDFSLSQPGFELTWNAI